MTDAFKQSALDYHRAAPAGKLEIKATKQLSNQRDLALAYSPGVAAACEAIVDDPNDAAVYTTRGNLVGVITNGTAVLGLGAIGALASKPVMEGKAVLFKKFANIDVFDIEVDELDPQKFIDIVASLEPTFGGINLEDIKAPECFVIEEGLKEKLKIPVFHDDQHGTAITVTAAITNGLDFVGKDIKDIKLVTCGAGAAALACLNLLVAMGLPKENITICDIEGVVYEGRTALMDPYKNVYARKTNDRTLEDAIKNADVFLGLSAPGVLKPAWLKTMADKPIIMALANPTPEILPELAKEARPDAIIATGRSDYPNQVNNVLCFPYIFRGALDVGATAINDEMKIACVRAIQALAKAEPSDVVARAYDGESLTFGADYIIPKPFDPRLIVEIAPAVAEAAMNSGVATRPLKDIEAYKQHLTQFVFRSGLVMKPVFEQAKRDPKRLLFAEGEEDRVLRAVQACVDEKLCKPILLGNPEIIADKIEALGLRIKENTDYTVVDGYNNPDFDDRWKTYHDNMERRGISPDYAQALVRSRPTVLAALMVKNGEADAMLCGSIGRYHRHLQHIHDVIGLSDQPTQYAAMNALILDRGTYFICDTHVNADPTAEEIANTTMLAAEEVERFGVKPKIALLSHSNFGSHDTASAVKMQQACAILREKAPHLEVEGEMHANAALDEKIRERIFPNSNLSGEANLLVMPNLDAANITFNALKILGDGLSIGPLLLGAASPVHIMTPSISTRGILNMAALAVVDAQE